MSVSTTITIHAEQGETLGKYRKSLKPKVVLDNGIKKLNYGLDLGFLKGNQFTG